MSRNGALDHERELGHKTSVIRRKKESRDILLAIVQVIENDNERMMKKLRGE